MKTAGLNNLKLLGALVLTLILASCGGHQDSKQYNVHPEEKESLENPFIHSVYFWFKESTTQEEIDAFYADTEKLRQIESVRGLFYGKPASTDRPIVEKSYDLAVIVHFKDLAGHDAYQQDQIHLDLLSTHSDIWEKVMVTDVDPH